MSPMIVKVCILLYLGPNPNAECEQLSRVVLPATVSKSETERQKINFPLFQFSSISILDHLQKCRASTYSAPLSEIVSIFFLIRLGLKARVRNCVDQVSTFGALGDIVDEGRKRTVVLPP